MESFKCVVIGDAAQGKTCMLMTYMNGVFPDEYVPTVFDNYNKQLKASDGNTYKLSIWDTAGSEELDRMRALFYPQGNVFIVCFSVVSPESFASVTERWRDDLSVHAPNKPFILVGTKTDLRDDKQTVEKLAKTGLAPITPEQGAELAEKIGAKGYLECSARSQTGLSEIFEKVLNVAVELKGKSAPASATTSSSKVASPSSKSVSSASTTTTTTTRKKEPEKDKEKENEKEKEADKEKEKDKGHHSDGKKGNCVCM